MMYWRFSVFIVNFEHSQQIIQDTNLQFLLITLNM